MGIASVDASLPVFIGETLGVVILLVMLKWFCSPSSSVKGVLELGEHNVGRG
ncbi:hypothetical protein ACP70R_035269 [Stipagrostis hirtigluma subsp. patula]